MLSCRSRTATCTWNRFILFSFRSLGLTGGRGARRTYAAVLREKGDQAVHVFVVRAVDDEAALLPALRQRRARQSGEMKGERRGGQVELFADRPCSQPRRARLHQEAKDRQTRVLRERGKSLEGLRR